LSLIAASLAPWPALGQGAPAEIPAGVVSGGRRLSGTLTVPDASTRCPVVLIIAGSGPTDRDGNNPFGIRADTYKQLAHALARAGIASLRYDKRYVGASNVPPLDESRVHYEDEVADAVAWIRELKADPRFKSVTIAGHSQGSLTGMLAAERVMPSALISLEGPGRDGGTLLLDQVESRFPLAVAEKARAIVAGLEDGQTSSDVPRALYTLLRPSVQPYLMSWFPYDPAREIAQMRCPVTIVQGTDDTQVLIVDAQTLKDSLPSARLVLVQGMTHTLKRVGPDIAQIRTYLDPTLPIVPEAVEAVIAAANAA
jgi:pimeloyl-ACP methyl ester carboxylesterase